MNWLAKFLRWLSDLIWPGEWAKDAAKKNFMLYKESKDVASLVTAIEDFELAVGQYRKHQDPSLVVTLVNYAVAVWRHYVDVTRSADDLETVIRLDTEALDSWSGAKNTKTYVLLLETLAGAYFEQYQRAFLSNPVNHAKKTKAFDKALKYYTKLKDTPVVSWNQRSETQIQLGVMFRMRCDLEKTLDRFEFGVQQLQDALSEATSAGQEASTTNEHGEAKQVEIDNVKATCLQNLATLYDIRYEIMNDSKNIQDLTKAIGYNTMAKPLLDDLGRPDLSTCMFNLARQLWLRWRQTRNPNDYNAAKQLADATKAIPGLDEQLTASIDALLDVLKPGTLDSDFTGVADTPGTKFIPRRRDTL